MIDSSVAFDDPISRNGLDVPEDLWFELAFGVAIHRYFLHADDFLTVDFALDFTDRRSLFGSAINPAQVETKAGLARRIADSLGKGVAALALHTDFGTVMVLEPGCVGESFSATLSGALRLVKTPRLRGIVELGALGIVATDSVAIRPPWIKLLGIVCVPSESSPEEAARTVLGQATENIYFAFLYAGLREGYIFGDKDCAVQEIAGHLMRVHGDALSSINHLDTLLLDRSCPSIELERSSISSSLIGKTPDYMPLIDFVHTVTGSQLYLDKYLRGLGIGQS